MSVCRSARWTLRSWWQCASKAAQAAGQGECHFLAIVLKNSVQCQLSQGASEAACSVCTLYNALVLDYGGQKQVQEWSCKQKLCFSTSCPVLPCRQDLTAAKAAIEELFGKIREIRRKAEASEIMVQEICRDIRKLDFAKTHLTHTITALRRLAMLVNAVGMSLRCTGSHSNNLYVHRWGS